MEFNPWKDYTPPAYLPPPILPLPMPKSRPNAYIIPHRQKPSPGRKNTKFAIAPLPNPLDFMPTFEEFRQQRAEEKRIAKEKAEAFACRRCPEKFPSNTKLHQHVQEKHSRKPKEPTSIEKPPPAAAPASPPPTPSAPASLPTPLPTPPAAATTPPATPTTTPRKPISWAEVTSRPKPITPSRIPLPTALPTPPPSPVLLPLEPTNHITKRPSTPAMKPYLTMKDLYARFHGKPRPMSLTTMQNRLQPAPSSGQMPHRQMRITAYFKPAILSKAPLASNKKHAESKTHGQSTQNRELASSFSSVSASHPTRQCRRCKQHLTSKNMLHRHLQRCIADTKRWPPADDLTDHENAVFFRFVWALLWIQASKASDWLF